MVAPEELNPVIAVSGLRFRYPGSESEFVFDDFSVERGERVAITGRSGCGKTTLLRLLTGLLRPARGTVRVLERVVHELSEAECRSLRVTAIGSIPQELDLLDYLPTGENILLPFLVNRAVKCDHRAQGACLQLAQRLGLEGKLSRYPHQLSQGERQRAAIARALITRPPILVADEPTGNLDGETALQVLDLIGDLIDDQGTTFLMVTHDVNLLSFFGKRLALNDLPAPCSVR